jgi:tripartite-type tricarboxylate transporter receptor subunit TctC
MPFTRRVALRWPRPPSAAAPSRRPGLASPSASSCRPRPAAARTSSELVERLGDEGADAASGTPEQFAALIRDEIPRWGKVVKESGAKVD